MKKLSLIAVFVLCLTLLIGVNQNATCFASEVKANTITVSGTGEIKITPDKACISVGIETFNEDLSTANNDNTQKTNNVISYLKQSGILEDNIKTRNYFAYQQYDYNEGRKLLGYEVTNCLDFCTSDFTQIPTLISGIIDNGATSFNGISLDYTNKETAYNNALEMALNNATAKATTLAQGASVSIKEIREQCSYFSSCEYNTYLLANSSSNDTYSPASMKVLAYIEAEFYINQNENNTTDNATNQNITNKTVDTNIQNDLDNENDTTNITKNTQNTNNTNNTTYNLSNDTQKDIDTLKDTETDKDRTNDTPPPPHYRYIELSKPMKFFKERGNDNGLLDEIHINKPHLSGQDKTNENNAIVE